MSGFETGETNRTESDEIQWGGKGINAKIKAGQETEINGVGPAIPADALEELFFSVLWLFSRFVL